MLKSNFKFFILALLVAGLVIAGAYTFFWHPGDVQSDVDPLQTNESAPPPANSSSQP